MKFFFAILPVIFVSQFFGQQLSIPRVDQMPDLPEPYEMRDWKKVAREYDSIVFDLDATGQYLPLASVFENTTNYPEHPALAIQSYVGTNSPPGKEAINVIPAVVGATLVGIDKSNQQGINWALYCEEYFNRRPSENVYLNGPVTSSGNDWWYETMPNIFFYQLNALYPNTGDFNYQVTTLADRWLSAVYAMGGNTTPWEEPYMNYRAFKLSTMTPNASGVKQPEAAGAIAWILYQAYQITGVDKYRIGAELSMEFLNGWSDNPSYEIQLPYGVYVAARMNAEMGTTYDIEKLLNWCFDRGDLRGWGVITGEWNGIDMDGLIGEVNEPNPDYVFHMNSLEHIGALVPMVRYDDRYATAIAKWVLNAANASRFYYSAFLDAGMQDNEDWTALYDPNSVIAYESMRETSDGPYGTGDAMNGGWASTNLGLYGSSHVGIIGAIIEKTNVEGILRLDLLATDYYQRGAFPTHLYFNPFDEEKYVELKLYNGFYDIYDAVSNQVLMKNATDIVLLAVAPKAAVMTVILPPNSEIAYNQNQVLVEGTVIDYNAELAVANYPPRIKSLSAADTVALTGSQINIYCTAEDRESTDLEYSWWVDGTEYDAAAIFTWNVPEETGYSIIKCKVTDEDGRSDVDSISIEVVEKINYPPVIEKISAEERILDFNASTNITCTAKDENGDELTYSWRVNSGTIEGSGNTITYTSPESYTNAYLVCEVSDPDSAQAEDSLLILVRDPGSGQTGDLIAHYVFDMNTKDISGNEHHGTETNCIYVEDMFGLDKKAIRFNISNSKVTVPNDDQLNFQDGLTVSYWISVEDFFDRESYPVSHGNWTTRWKTSLTDQRVRFTINGSSGIVDIDSDNLISKDEWVHVVGLYDGLDCLLFLDGELAGFKPYEGQINKTSYDLVLGQSLPDQSGFNFKGKMDNLRIYNYGISYERVREIYTSELSSIMDNSPDDLECRIYPNPARDKLWISCHADPLENIHIEFLDVSGLVCNTIHTITGSDGKLYQEISLDGLNTGVFLILLKSDKTLWTRKFVRIE